ncbi:MAG: outer membrane lipoprotein carrier protein LolA [Nitrospirae bacterium]|jgi:chaperone LolA|nr:outer membrane lipoprotein carrier protein LolA [Nitrospirota bacterium]
MFKERRKLNYSFGSLLILGIFLMYFTLYLNSTSHALSLNDEIARIQKTYEDITDMSGNFVQKSHLKDLKRTDTYKGQFFIKKPQKVKVIYKGEHPAEITVNKDIVLIYQKNENQVIKGKFDTSTYGQTPVILLSGLGKMEEEFNISEKNGLLLLKPKKSMGAIVSIELKLSENDFPIQSFTIYDTYSNRTEITLSNMKINKNIDDKIFNFTPPKNATVLEHNP